MSKCYSGIQPAFLPVAGRIPTSVHRLIENWTASLLSIGYQELVMCWRKDDDQESWKTGVFHIQMETSGPLMPRPSLTDEELRRRQRMYDEWVEIFVVVIC